VLKTQICVTRPQCVKHGPFKEAVLGVCTMKELRYKGITLVCYCPLSIREMGDEGLQLKCREVNQSVLKT